MRICMLNNLFPPIPSGSSHFTYALSKTLAARGHDVTVVSARAVDAPSVETRHGVEIHRLSCRMLPRMQIAHGFRHLSFTLTPGNLRRVEALCRDKRFDLLHQHGQIFDLALISVRLARKLRLPLVNTIHTPAHHTTPLYHALLGALDRTVVRRLIIEPADMLVAPDRTVVDYIARRYRHRRVVEIPYGVDSPATSESRGLEVRRRHGIGEGPVILSVGHVHNLRDRCDLIAAMPGVLRQVPDARMLVVGDIYTQRPIALARSLGLESRVIFAGAVAHEQIGDYLSAATIEAHWLGSGPGLGIAAMEAMAAGVPVVSSIDQDAFGRGLLRPGENVMLIERGSSRSIVDTLIALLKDAELRQRVGAGGRRLVEKCFSWPSVAARTEAAYEELVGLGERRYGARLAG
ncbi:MAG: glycosyltransferase family 4 protein [Myxococcota bacterium]